MLNWDDLRIFLALARNLKLGSAARSVGIDPTTLSRRMARLAHSMNATLFEQHDGQQVLTPRGRELLILAETAEAAIIQMGGLGQAETSGLVRVAVPESLGIWFLANRMAEFKQLHPNVVVDLISPSWIFSPLKREVDIGILPQRPARGPLTTRRLVTTTLRLYASKAYLDGRPPIRSLADLPQHNFVSYLRESLPDDELSRWTDIVPGASTNMRTTSIAIQWQAVREGGGIGLLPYYVGKQDPDLVMVLKDEVRVAQGFWLVVREDIRHSTRVTAFVNWLNKLVKENASFFHEPNFEQPTG